MRAGISDRARAVLTAAVVAAGIWAPAAARACSVCYGDPNSPQTKAMAAGILLMLGVVGTVLASFAAAFCYWMVRSHRLSAANEGATN